MNWTNVVFSDVTFDQYNVNENLSVISVQNENETSLKWREKV